jgi:hypothetical protein
MGPENGDEWARCTQILWQSVSEPERATAISHGPGDWLRSGMLLAAQVPVPAVGCPAEPTTGIPTRREPAVRHATRPTPGTGIPPGSQSPAPRPPQGARINRNAYKKVRRRDLQTPRKYVHTLGHGVRRFYGRAPLQPKGLKPVPVRGRSSPGQSEAPPWVTGSQTK